MATIYCAICGEPWDRYGVSHGDVTPGEAEMILQGRGCPCCEGESEDRSDDRFIQALRSTAESWDDCPIAAMDRMFTSHDRPYAPDEIKATGEHKCCEDCGLTVRPTLPDTHAEWKEGKTGEPEVTHTRASYHRWGCRTDPDPDDFRTLDGHDYCTQCAPDCKHCGEPTIPEVDQYHRQEGMNVEYYHADCLCEVMGEKHRTWQTEKIGNVLWQNDIECATDIDHGPDIDNDLGWYSEGPDPSDDAIIAYLAQHNALYSEIAD